MPDDSRLSQLETRWSLLVRSHTADPDCANAARAEFLPRYCAPVFRYLHGIVGDEELAEELAQEFAVRFLRGDFRHARPERGRFRDYLKAALRHLVSERLRRPSLEVVLSSDSRVLFGVAAPQDDISFVEIWRKELFNRVWADLAADSREKGSRLYEVLRLKADDPDRDSETLAALLARGNGQEMTAAAARQLLHRARIRFAELLRAEVAATLGTNDPAAIDDELAELKLLAYCGPQPSQDSC